MVLNVTHTCTGSGVLLLVMLSSAVAEGGGGRLCMALPGKLSHTKIHTLGLGS